MEGNVTASVTSHTRLSSLAEWHNVLCRHIQRTYGGNALSIAIVSDALNTLGRILQASNHDSWGCSTLDTLLPFTVMC